MTDDLSFEITHRSMWFFSKDLFGEPQNYIKKSIIYFCIYFAWVFTPILAIFLFPNTTFSLSYILFLMLNWLLATVVSIYKSRIKITDKYFVDENNNLVITRQYSGNKSLTKTIMAEDIKGFKLYQLNKINPRTKILAIDTTQGDFVLDFYSQDIQKLHEFLLKYYPNTENNGFFRNIEAGIKRFNIFCVLIICIIIMGFIYSYTKTLYNNENQMDNSRILNEKIHLISPKLRVYLRDIGEEFDRNWDKTIIQSYDDKKYTTTVVFTINKNGLIDEKRIVSKSNNDSLDDSVSYALKNINKVDVPPNDYNGEQIYITFNYDNKNEYANAYVKYPDMKNKESVGQTLPDNN